MQTPIVSHKWSLRNFIPGVSAKETFEVSGVASDSEAISAVGIGFLSSHPQDARLIVPVGGITVSQDGSTGPMIYRVSIDYTTNAIQSVGTPLDEPADISIRFAEETRPIEKEWQGNAIVNGARLPLTGVTEPALSMHFTIAQWESTFDIGKAIDYTYPFATLNSDVITIPRVGVLQPGQLLLRKMFTEQPFRAMATDKSKPYLRIVYQCEARGYFVVNRENVSGFAKRQLDQGRQGTYADSSGDIKIGAIVYGEKDENGNWVAVPDDVRLDGFGGVFDYPKMYVKSGDAAQGTWPDPPPGAVIENTDNGVFLYWVVNKPLPFAALGWKFK